MRIPLAYIYLLSALLLGACQPSGKAPTPPPASTPKFGDEITAAQSKRPTLKLWLGPLEIEAELCRTALEIQTGMMFRTNLAEMSGMLFVFPEAAPRSFWMKNCPHALSCAYIGADGTILETHDMKPFDQTSIPSISDRVQFVLEVNQGWFERNKLGQGTLIRTERGSLPETFFGKR